MYRNVKGTGPVRSHFIGRYIKGYGMYMKFKKIYTTTHNNHIVQKRLQAITFFEKHGLEATMDAFNISKSTIYLWRKKLRDARYNEMALIPKSTRPKHTRKMIVDRRILRFIKELREKDYILGKRKIKVLLDEYCRQEGIQPISESLIGKIIRRNNWYYKPRRRIYHDPNRNYKRKKKKKRISSRYKPKEAGEILQIDTIVRFDMGIKRYIITAVDLKGKFAYARAYKRLSSRMAMLFMKELEIVAPFKIKAVKTDNGFEFCGEFDEYLRKKGITHYWSYPKTPKSNAYIERFNRTIQEEFIDANIEYLEDVGVFNEKMIEYLLYYNTVRPHQALNYETPMGYLVSRCNFSKMCVTRTISFIYVLYILLCLRKNFL